MEEKKANCAREKKKKIEEKRKKEVGAACVGCCSCA